MIFFITVFIILQALLCIPFIFPIILKLLEVKKQKLTEGNSNIGKSQFDYAIIVTYYGQIDLLPSLLDSINKLNHKEFIVYIVADNCNNILFDSKNPKVVFLKPALTLKDNIKSHQYAIQNFIRPHDCIVILDGDNLVHPNFLVELDRMFSKGYLAVQGARYARNMNTDYAILDAVGDLYFRYIDRILLFNAGSSAALSGSGMAFSTSLFIDCIKDYNSTGAGFDKILQHKIVKKKFTIAFSNDVIVYDQKTTNSDQLIKQRARWINTWFKSLEINMNLFFYSILTMSRNGFLFSIAVLRPPLFIFFTIVFFCFVINIFFFPLLNLLWLLCLFLFVITFFEALKSLRASKEMFRSLIKIPEFIFFQFCALFKAKNANKISVATKHTILD